jgi:hypothetical protein
MVSASSRLGGGTFKPLLEVITLREGSGIALIVEPKLGPHDHDEASEAAIPCFWWRRGRVPVFPKHAMQVEFGFKVSPFH